MRFESHLEGQSSQSLAERSSERLHDEFESTEFIDRSWWKRRSSWCELRRRGKKSDEARDEEEERGESGAPCDPGAAISSSQDKSVPCEREGTAIKGKCSRRRASGSQLPVTSLFRSVSGSCLPLVVAKVEKPGDDTDPSTAITR